jgi:hypothetical protein
MGFEMKEGFCVVSCRVESEKIQIESNRGV